MLSGETAKGLYPVLTVETMHKICLEAEAALYTDSLFADLSAKTQEPADQTATTALAAVNASLSAECSAIIVITSTGNTAHLVSKYRPKCPTITVCHRPIVARQAHLWRGLYPYVFEGVFALDSDWAKDVEARVADAIGFGRRKGCIKSGDKVVVITGWRPGSGASNTLAVIDVV
jgi:pyruvate kinase